MTSFTIDEITIPATLDAPDAADFVRSIEVSSEVECFEYGTHEMSFTAAEALPGYLDAEFQPRRVFAARVDDQIVARGVYESIAGETDVGWINIRVLPGFRGQGIGTGLADLLEDLGRANNRARLITYAVSAEAPGDRLPSPTGFGSLPSQRAEVQFLLRRGYSLEQVERGSRLALPVEESMLQNMFDAAAAGGGTDYALHFWVGRTEERWLANMADLFTNMSIEEPSAGLEEPANEWTVQRVIDSEERETASGETRLVAVVEHLPTHRLIGHSILGVPTETDRPVRQQDTLVLPGHRGHRLGLLLKVANIQQLQRLRPGHPAIVTFNAEENRHMLAVNEAVGFVPIGHEGAWKKMLR